MIMANNRNEDTGSRKRYGGDDIRVIKMLVQETGTFKNVFNRSWVMNLENNNLENVRRRLVAAGRSAPLTTSAFQGISSSILAPVADVDPARDLIRVPEGWDRQRCRFMMEIEVDNRFGSIDSYFIQGFSEHLGLTRAGNLDEKMLWYINGFIRVQHMERDTRRGVEHYCVVKSSAQVINGRLIYDRDRPVEKTRTVDLFNNIQERFYQTGYADKVEDTRCRLDSPADSIFASRGDNLPGQYLSSAINTYRRNIDNNSFGTGTEDILGRTQQELNSTLIGFEENPFLAQLAMVQGRHSTTEFTLEDLFEIDPDAEKEGVIQGGMLNAKGASRLATHESDVSDWQGADLESQWAVQIANSLSAIMMQKFYRGLSVRLSNMNYERRLTSEVRSADGMAEGLPEEIFESMMDDVEFMMNDLSGDGRREFSVDIVANLYDQTELRISIDGDRTQRFFVPSFADSLMSQSYSRDDMALSNLSEDLESILTDLSGEIGGSVFDVAKL